MMLIAGNVFAEDVLTDIAMLSPNDALVSALRDRRDAPFQTKSGCSSPTLTAEGTCAGSIRTNVPVPRPEDSMGRPEGDLTAVARIGRSNSSLEAPIECVEQVRAALLRRICRHRIGRN
jgi:hypothetical protein